MSTQTDPTPEPKSPLEQAVEAITVIFTRLLNPKYKYTTVQKKFTMGQAVDMLELVNEFGEQGYRVMSAKTASEPSEMTDHQGNRINRIVAEFYLEKAVY